MKKSDVVVKVLLETGDPKRTEAQLREQLSIILNELAIDLDKWDTVIPTPIVNAMVKNLAARRGRISMSDLIRDIDIILGRIL
jgi:hypothetical protein